MAKYEEWITPEGLLKIEGWARDGLTDEQIAHNIGINTSTIYDWKNKFDEFSKALKRGKEVVDREVENALLKRALGYKFTETKTVHSEKDGERVEITIKEVVPDVTAQIFWLKNRKPDKWRDKQDVHVEGNVNNPFAGLSTEELKKLAKDG
jgi:transposase